MSHRFLIDAQLPPGLAEFLASLCVRAEHVTDVGLGAATDREIWAWAKRAGATVITKDQDFAALSRHDPAGPAVIWVRLGNTTNRSLRETLTPIVPLVLAALDKGERLIEIG